MPPVRRRVVEIRPVGDLLVFLITLNDEERHEFAPRRAYDEIVFSPVRPIPDLENISFTISNADQCIYPSLRNRGLELGVRLDEETRTKEPQFSIRSERRSRKKVKANR